MSLPDEMQEAKHPIKFIFDIVQVGREVFFGRDEWGGVAVHNLQTGDWHILTMKDGLGSDCVGGLIADGENVWITGAGFLNRYAAGKVFLYKDKVPNWVEAVVKVGGDMCYLGYDPANLVILNPADERARRTVTEEDMRRLYPAPDFFWPPARQYNAGCTGRRRLLARPEGLYVATKLGLVLIGNDSRPQRLWYPTGFCWWQGLGLWVEGNCPLPPCGDMEVIADDRKSDLVWIVNKRLTGYAGDTTFITALDVKKQIFSVPVRTNAPFFRAQPFGDYVYVTGKEFGRISKTTWVLDQPAPAGDQPVRVHCPNTPLGRAAQALFDQDFDRARKHLLEAIDAGIAPAEVKKMLAEIERMQEARQRAGTGG